MTRSSILLDHRITAVSSLNRTCYDSLSFFLSNFPYSLHPDFSSQFCHIINSHLYDHSIPCSEDHPRMKYWTQSASYPRTKPRIPKMRFQPALIKTFCQHSATTHLPTTKALQITIIIKLGFISLPPLVFYKIFNYIIIEKQFHILPS